MTDYVFTMHQDFGKKIHHFARGVDAAKQMADNYANASIHLKRERFTVTNEDTGEELCKRWPARDLKAIDWSNQ